MMKASIKKMLMNSMILLVGTSVKIKSEELLYSTTMILLKHANGSLTKEKEKKIKISKY